MRYGVMAHDGPARPHSTACRRVAIVNSWTPLATAVVCCASDRDANAINTPAAISDQRLGEKAIDRQTPGRDHVHLAIRDEGCAKAHDLVKAVPRPSLIGVVQFVLEIGCVVGMQRARS